MRKEEDVVYLQDAGVEMLKNSIEPFIYKMTATVITKLQQQTVDLYE